MSTLASTAVRELAFACYPKVCPKGWEDISLWTQYVADKLQLLCLRVSVDATRGTVRNVYIFPIISGVIEVSPFLSILMFLYSLECARRMRFSSENNEPVCSHLAECNDGIVLHRGDKSLYVKLFEYLCVHILPSMCQF